MLMQQLPSLFPLILWHLWSSAGETEPKPACTEKVEELLRPCTPTEGQRPGAKYSCVESQLFRGQRCPRTWPLCSVLLTAGSKSPFTCGLWQCSCWLYSSKLQSREGVSVSPGEWTSGILSTRWSLAEQEEGE